MKCKEREKLRTSYDFLMGMLWVHEDFKGIMRKKCYEELMSFIDEKLLWKE